MYLRRPYDGEQQVSETSLMMEIQHVSETSLMREIQRVSETSL